LQAARIDAPRLLDAKIVTGKSKTRAQAKPAEIQPARLEGRALLSTIRIFKKNICKLADSAQRP
jgi:hypothetical protein